jgi:DNA-binding response OmpR family regulator
MKSKIRILLADDDRDDRFLFQEALSEIDIETTLETVHDGEQLLKYLNDNTENLPDVLFLDLNMPRINGFECLSEIKITDKIKEIPVIMFSTSFPRDAHYEQDMIQMLLKIGATDYIRKPANFNELKEVIKNSLLKISELMSSK